MKLRTIGWCDNDVPQLLVGYNYHLPLSECAGRQLSVQQAVEVNHKTRKVTHLPNNFVRIPRPSPRTLSRNSYLDMSHVTFAEVKRLQCGTALLVGVHPASIEGPDHGVPVNALRLRWLICGAWS